MLNDCFDRKLIHINKLIYYNLSIYFMLSPIVFLHIPKTAGTTFLFLLREIGERNNVYYKRYDRPGILANFTVKDFITERDIGIYGGHYVFSDECKNFDLFTLVRDVHKTFFSNIYYQYFHVFLQRNLNKENIHTIKKNIDLNLRLKESDESIINDLIKKNMITSNPFTKTFAGIPYEKYFYVEDDYKITKTDYKMAVDNIKYFKLIGNSDSMETFVNKFLSLYGFNLKQYTHQRVASYDRNFIDLMVKKFHHQIINYNYYDILLMNEIEKNNKKV